MTYKDWHTIIIAYRLEDRYGYGPFFYNGHEVILPEGYIGAFLNPNRLCDEDYIHLYHKYSLCEYLLLRTAQVYETGEVLFRHEDIISKSFLGR